MPKTVLIANSGGGVGKTTIASELAIVDTPGALTENLGKYMQTSDLIAVPTHMSYRDQSPLELMTKTVRDAGLPAIYVLSQWNRYRVCADFLSWFKVAYPDEAVLAMPQSELFPQAGLAGCSARQLKLDSFPAQQVNQLIGMVEQQLNVGLKLWGKEVKSHG